MSTFNNLSNYIKETVKYVSTKKNKSSNPFFIKICKMNQKDLKAFLNKELAKYYKNVIAQDGFLYAKGKDKICLTAHMDTVHTKKIKDYYESKTEDGMKRVYSPQGIGGDDRCGIYMILEILRRTNLRPTILFCEDEEVGGVGSRKFCKTKFIKDLEKMYYLIELDRKGNKDLVFYDDDNTDFHKYLEELTGYETAFGSFSDISNLSPACKISSVNISCGYYNAHTTNEYVVLKEMENSINTVILMMNEAIKNDKQYEYIERKKWGFGSAYNGYDRYDGYDYYDSYFTRIYQNQRNFSNNISRIEEEKPKLTLWIMFKEYDKEEEDYFESEVESEMWEQFFIEHPSVCYNDIIDYDVFRSDMSDYKGIDTGIL